MTAQEPNPKDIVMSDEKVTKIPIKKEMSLAGAAVPHHWIQIWDNESVYVVCEFVGAHRRASSLLN